MRKTYLSLIVLAILTIQSCGSEKTKTEEVAVTTETQEEAVESERVYFVSPEDGATVPTTFKVVMGVEGMTVEPAGEVKEGFGHHHVLINQSGWPGGEIIPPSDTTIHFGKGQTETDLTLEPGDYMISLQFADGVHRSYGESMAASIQVTVQE